ncbi:hypothetical protein BaRGS_00009880 [Batillaria attramentaria]|uniref:Secreted protein n=1 Tax=Batillaria attramentaria TaxID=370345 RepID=A0ABD0LHA5_9CAEN
MHASLSLCSFTVGLTEQVRTERAAQFKRSVVVTLCCGVVIRVSAVGRVVGQAFQQGGGGNGNRRQRANGSMTQPSHTPQPGDQAFISQVRPVHGSPDFCRSCLLTLHFTP